MEHVKLDDFLGYHFLSAVEFSPDGRYGAFVVSKPDAEQNCYRSAIHLYDTRTGRTRPLTGGGAERSFVWLDGQTILFPAMRDATLQKRVEAGEPWTVFYTIGVDGGEAAEYMRVPAKVLKIKPMDGRYFALVCRCNNDLPDPHACRDGEREQVLKALQEESDYMVADELPFMRNGLGYQNGVRDRLFLYDRQTGKMTPISGLWENVEFFSVRPGEIVYAAMPFRKEEPLMYSCAIFLYSQAENAVRQLLPAGTYRLRYMDYLGDEIGFAGSDMRRWGPNENPYFYTLSREGELKLRVKNERSACSYVLSDCRYGSGADFRHMNGEVYFLRGAGGHAVICRLDRDGRFGDLTGEDGVVDCFDVSREEILFVAMRGTRLQELYSLKDGAVRQLTHLNDWVQRERLVSEPEPFTFQNDGYDITGYVMKPADFDPGKRYPAILDIHGGPKCAYGPIFYHEFQYRASQGYFVIYCNPRGSEGRDNEFADVIDKYGTIDYDDIMKFTDRCLERYPQIDPHRLGVAGGSYGGFMTNWIIGHTDRFRCATSQRGIASFVTQFGTSDTGYRFPLNKGMGANIWADHERFWDRSPLKYADRCTTPTLFIHSAEDYRCPLQEAVQMYTALKYFHVDTRLVIFKGESHELSRSGKPSHRIRRMREISDWFETYLKD